MTKNTPLLPIATIAALLMVAPNSGCDDIIEDSSFQAWCGDQLCSWDVDDGRIARVGTWHPADYGVELVETPTALSQLTGDGPLFVLDQQGVGFPPDEIEMDCVASGGIYLSDPVACVVPNFGGPTDCIRFELIADVDPGAQVQIEVDYGADGTVDLTEPVVASNWQPVSFLAPIPAWHGYTRYRIHKRGQGRAVIAHFGVFEDRGCADTAPTDNRPIGVACEASDECTSGICASVGPWTACGECETDASCGAGETCQVVTDDYERNGIYRACRIAP